MPRRFMVARDCPPQSNPHRLTNALHRAVDGPSKLRTYLHFKKMSHLVLIAFMP